MIAIGRHINGITINPLEWVLNDDETIMEFATQEIAEQFLLDNGVEADDLEWYTFRDINELINEL